MQRWIGLERISFGVKLISRKKEISKTELNYTKLHKLLNKSGLILNHSSVILELEVI